MTAPDCGGSGAVCVDRIYRADSFDMLPSIADGSVDLVVCDGPWGVTANEWDRIGSVQEFNLRLIRIFAHKLKDGGALYLFGKPDCIDFIDYRPFLNLRSKIVWYNRVGCLRAVLVIPTTTTSFAISSRATGRKLTTWTKFGFPSSWSSNTDDGASAFLR